MPVSDVAVIDDYLRALSGRLMGPARLRNDLLTEARDSLSDATEAYQDGGLPPGQAARRAVDEFGPVARIAADYQSELAAGTLRALSGRVILVAALLVSSADLMWRGAPWTGSEPPASYLLLSTTLHGLWIVTGLLAVGSRFWLVRGARAGRTAMTGTVRRVGYGMAALLVVAWLAGMALFGWTTQLWRDSFSWPPMMVGSLLTTAGYTWITLALRDLLLTAGSSLRRVSR